MIPERAEDHRQLARWPTDDPSQNRVGRLRRTLDRISQALHQIEAHRYAAAGAVAGGGALAPHTWLVELHRQRAGSRHQHRQTSGGVGRVPEQRQCVRRFWLHQRRQEYRVLADAHTVAPQSREPRFTHMVQIFLRRIERTGAFDQAKGQAPRVRRQAPVTPGILQSDQRPQIVRHRLRKPQLQAFARGIALQLRGMLTTDKFEPWLQHRRATGKFGDDRAIHTHAPVAAKHDIFVRRFRDARQPAGYFWPQRPQRRVSHRAALKTGRRARVRLKLEPFEPTDEVAFDRHLTFFGNTGEQRFFALQTL